MIFNGGPSIKLPADVPFSRDLTGEYAHCESLEEVGPGNYVACSGMFVGAGRDLCYQIDYDTTGHNDLPPHWNVRLYERVQTPGDHRIRDRLHLGLPTEKTHYLDDTLSVKIIELQSGKIDIVDEFVAKRPSE